MSKLLEGKVALITGGGRGLGRGIALAMAAAGAKVVVNDLGASLDGRPDNEQPANEVVSAIRSAGGEAIADGGSVADWVAANKMVEAAVNAFGRIDIVVNNAGILRDVMFHRMSEPEFDQVLAVHLKGSFNV
ncbi:MAG: family NAD(P)-dependent oxidoreductase, partial [Variovorax sp.]|nr:family NAD(P)-dependent oxidoreductase [Variovorax sp.]